MLTSILIIFIVNNNKPITSACNKIVGLPQLKKNPSTGQTASACDDNVQSGHVPSTAMEAKG